VAAVTSLSTFVRRLVDDGSITAAQLEDARALRAGSRRALLRCLVDTGAMTDDGLTGLLAKHTGLAVVEATALTPDPGLIRRVSYRVARLRGAIPLRLEGVGVLVAMSDPTDVVARDDLVAALGAPVTPILATPSAIDRAITAAYRSDEVAALEVVERCVEEGGPIDVIPLGAVSGVMERPLSLGDMGRTGEGPGAASGMHAMPRRPARPRHAPTPTPAPAAAAVPMRSAAHAASEAAAGLGAAHEVEDPADVAIEAASPVVRLVALVLRDAVRRRASDIHFEPHQERFLVRYRVDGVLRDIQSLPTSLASPVTSRIKIMARMNITITRKPQDARAKLRTQGREIDLRVSTLPTLHGEKTVIRILDPQNIQIRLADLFSARELSIFEALILRPQGMVLVTGPTGSGKTTTLYTALRRLEERARNIVTLEDPVEYKLDGVNQVEIKEGHGVSFPAALRAVLRQDPNVVLVGEIRDKETAHVAMQASITGHLVLSSLHTNDAAGAVARLVDLGVDPALVAEGLTGAVAQRLLRRLCPHCSEAYAPTAEQTGPVGELLSGAELHRPKGCERCDYCGFRGRVAAYEIFRVMPSIAALIAARASENELRKAARVAGIESMFDAALRLVRAGTATLEDALVKIARDPVEDAIRCAGCAGPLERDFRACPRCGRRVLASCAACKADLRPDWSFCARCGERAPVDPARPSGPRPTTSRGGAPPIAPEESGAPRSEVLVVDDAWDMRRILERVLTRAGYAVRLTDSGEGALREVASKKPDGVLLDLELPGMSGIDVCRRLRTQLETATLPIVMLTAGTEVGTEAEAHDAGANDYLTKPFTPAVLLQRLHLAMRPRTPSLASKT